MWVKKWPTENLLVLEEATIGGTRLRIHKNRPRNLPEILKRNADLYPGKEAFVFEDQRITYGELFRIVTRISGAFRSFGTQKGDRIALLLANTIEFVYSYLAVTSMGAIAVPLNYRLTPEELEYQIAHVGAKGLILDEEYWPNFESIQGKTKGLEKVFLVGKSAGCAGKKVLPFSDLINYRDSYFNEKDIDGEAIAGIVFTSGTTGRPKGVMLSHRNVIANALSVSHILLINHQAKQLIITPLFHVSALHGQLMTTLVLGATAVLFRKYSTKGTLETMSKEKITCIVAVPTMYWFWVTYPELDKYDLSSLRIASCGGAPASPELITLIAQKFPNTKFINAGGMTECTSCAWSLPPEFALTKLGSVGFALPCVDVRVVGEKGREVGVNEAGELWYKGPNVAMGYWNNEKAWAESFSDGWLHSGDIGKVDEDGFLWLLDRAKDMIIRGGENIYCIEVENVLHTHPKIAEAAVVGVPDKIFGEKVKAFLVVREGAVVTAEQIKEFCSAKLAGYKVPEFVEFMKELPRNPSGKVEKKKLRQLGG